jgi:uncharacterized protein YhdP
VWLAPLRLLGTLLGAALALALLLLIARELIAARVPEHRAALEQLIREQTGLQITFGRLALRWGWYGPEAVFRDVTLGEAGGAALLHATELTVGLDAWRSLRSGHPEAGRITLTGLDIDLSAQAPSVAGAGVAARQAGLIAAAPRLLSRWRGGRIDVEGASVRLAADESASGASLNVAHAVLQRLGARWSAQARLLLPGAPREEVLVTLELSGDPAHRETLAGALTVSGQGLTVARWRSLSVLGKLRPYLPSAGSGRLEFTATLARGTPLRIAGDFAVQAPEWQGRAAGAPALRLPSLQANWQLSRGQAGWGLAVGSLQVGSAGAEGSALVFLEAGRVRGRVHALPLPALQSLAHWYLPQLPLGEVTLTGLLQGAQFDWNGAQAPGERLNGHALVSGLTLARAASDLKLGTLSAHVSFSDTALAAQLDAPAASLRVSRTTPLTLAGLQVHAHLSAGFQGGAWYLRSEDLTLGDDGAQLAARVALAAAAGAAPELVARVQIQNSDAVQLAALLDPEALAQARPLLARLRAGRIESADFELAGALTAAPRLRSQGTLVLGDAALAAAADWPQVQGLAARIDWRDGQVRASLSAAHTGTLELISARASWDMSGAQALRIHARLRGDAGEALAWLRERPELGVDAPGATALDLDGDVSAALDLVIPGRGAHQPRPRREFSATLEGVRLRALAAVPPVEALTGTLSFTAGHLQRSSLNGQWLGGPVTLALSERPADSALLIAAHGRLTVREAVAASGVSAPALDGNAEWTAQLTALTPHAPGLPAWQVRADSGLAGVASALPAPFAKAAGSVLPLHLEAHGGDLGAQLQASLGERLRALALLRRQGERWRIERGALSLGTRGAGLPSSPVLALEGRIEHLDLAAYLALCRLAGRSPVLPPLEARLSAAELTLGSRSYAEVDVSARADTHGGELQAHGAPLSALFSWPATADSAHPARARIAQYELAAPADAAWAAALIPVLGGTVQLHVDELSLQGRALGTLVADLSPRGDALEASVHLAAAAQELQASARCTDRGACSARFSLDSGDFAATLAAFGLRPDLTAAAAHLAGELHWPDGPIPALGTLGGHLHMQLAQGETRTVRTSDPATPLALLLVPALVSGLATPSRSAPAALQFARLSADYEIGEGVASTANLHLDGDTEMLVRARVGLLSRDYEGEAFILRGEERLPAAVRRFGPTPKIAALWLSLRDWLTGVDAGPGRTVLRLRGAWNDPIVEPAQVRPGSS